MVLCRPSPCGRRLVDAVMARCIPRPPGFAHSAVLGWATNLPRHTHQLGPSAQPRRDGVGAATRPPDGVGRWGPLWHWGLPAKSAVRGPSAEAEKKRAATASGAGRRLVPTASASAPRALLPPCGFSHRDTQRQWALLADNETAQALQHGCGEDCWRSASLHCATRATASAALSAVANASSTSLAYKACV